VLDRVESRYALHEEALGQEEVTGAGAAPDVGSLRKLVAAARRRMDEAARQ
jgi:hypothetical protein